MAILIKRYANRKLYDTGTRSYTSLENVADYLRQGKEVQVIDNVSGEDITTATLAQVIAGQEKHDRGRFPGHMLAGLIHAGEQTALKLRDAFDWQTNVDDEIRRRVEDLVEADIFTPQEGQNLLDRLLAVGNTKPLGLDGRVAHILQEQNIPSRQDVLALSQQIDEILAQLDQG